MDAIHPLDLSQIVIRPLDKSSPIELFRCGDRDIDTWLGSQGRPLSDINRVRIFCAHLGDEQSVQGLYVLSFESKDTKRLLSDFGKFASIPVVYITYIAVLRSCQRQGLGSHLLIDALKRAHGVASHVGFYGVALRSLNDDTTRLYSRYGFVPVDRNTTPLMLLPVQALDALFGSPPEKTLA